MCAVAVRRVAFVVGTTAGGTGTHVRMLARGLADRGIDVLVAGPSRTGKDLGLDTTKGVRFSAVEFGDRPRPTDATAILALRRLLTTTRPDVVHAHGMRAGALTAIALTRTPTRKPTLVVTVHNAPPAGGTARLVYLALERVVARNADLVLAVSSDLERRMRAAGARDVQRAVVPAPDRPDPPPQQKPQQKPQQELQEPEPDRPLILAVGRLAPQKGFATLIDAAAAWQQRTPKPRLLIAGDGPLKPGLEARANDKNVDAEFPGHRPDIPELLAAAAVFVMPSLWEGQPLALQEALTAGVPIVASNAGGIPDLTGDDAAVLVEPGDTKELGQAVLSVLDDHDRATRLRSAARRRATALPAADDAVTHALAAYESVTGKRE
jgi:glycosyltransferase involved in cell wall biosynthesis